MALCSFVFEDFAAFVPQCLFHNVCSLPFYVFALQLCEKAETEYYRLPYFSIFGAALSPESSSLLSTSRGDCVCDLLVISLVCLLPHCHLQVLYCSSTVLT
jgi:hypothetical protein